MSDIFDDSGYCNHCGTHYENVNAIKGCDKCKNSINKDKVTVSCKDCGYSADDTGLTGTNSKGACKGCGGHNLEWY